MTAQHTATRAEAIAAAIDKFAGEDFLPVWDSDSEIGNYMRGICEVLADTFGTDDPENARSEVWEEMRIAFEHEKRRATAERIAAEQLADIEWNKDGHTPFSEHEIRAMLAAAVLAGMEAR